MGSQWRLNLLIIQCYFEINYIVSLQVHYNQFELTVKVADFNGTFTLGNLSPYTEYDIHLTAVKITQATGESLEGEESPVVGERTLAGGTVANFEGQKFSDHTYND